MVVLGVSLMILDQGMPSIPVVKDSQMSSVGWLWCWAYVRRQVGKDSDGVSA